MNSRRIINWVSRIVASLILLQTLFFKFTAHPDSVLLFTQLGLEPYGRIILGVVEFIVAVGLLIPRTSLKSAWAVVVLMIGAIFSHIFIIGIVFNNDSGGLFLLAVVTLVAGIVVVSGRKENG